MKVFAKELKKDDVFTESGITVKVVNVIHGNTLVNGKPVVLVDGIMIGYNPKIFPKSFSKEINTTCSYWKKADTQISVKR